MSRLIFFWDIILDWSTFFVFDSFSMGPCKPKDDVHVFGVLLGFRAVGICIRTLYSGTRNCVLHVVATAHHHDSRNKGGGEHDGFSTSVLF